MSIFNPHHTLSGATFSNIHPILRLFFFVVVRIVNALHEDFSIVNFIRRSILQKLKNPTCSRNTFSLLKKSNGYTMYAFIRLNMS